MSHKTTMKVEIRSLATLKKCLTDLGYTFEVAKDGTNSLRTKSPYAGANDSVCLRLSGYTDGKTDKNISCIGFRKESDNTIKVTGDFWRVRDINGKSVSANKITRDIKKRYTVSRITKELMTQGFSATKNKGGQIGTDGKIRMVFTRL